MAFVTAGTPAVPNSVPTPAGIAIGDRLFAMAVVTGFSGLNIPAGWTHLGTANGGSGFSDRRLGVWTRVATSTDVGGTSYNFSSTTSGAGVIVAYRDIDAVGTLTTSVSSGTSIQFPSATAAADDLLLCFGGLVDFDAATGISPPADATERVDTSSVTLDGTLYLADLTVATSGATGARSATVAGIGGQEICGISLPITPTPPSAIEQAVIAVTETDSVQSVSRTKRKAIATVTETDGAQAITAKRSRTLQPALETDGVGLISSSIVVQIATVTETDEALPLGKIDPIRVELATVTEADTVPMVTTQKRKAVAPATETNTTQALGGSALQYRLAPPSYQRVVKPQPGSSHRYTIDQAVSIVRINGTLRQFRNPSQTMLEAAGTEGRDWFIGGRIYDRISYSTHLELQAAGFETEAVA